MRSRVRLQLNLQCATWRVDKPLSPSEAAPNAEILLHVQSFTKNCLRKATVQGDHYALVRHIGCQTTRRTPADGNHVNHRAWWIQQGRDQTREPLEALLVGDPVGNGRCFWTSWTNTQHLSAGWCWSLVFYQCVLDIISTWGDLKKKKQPRDKYSSFIYSTSSKSMVLRTILLTSTNIIYQVLSLILLLLLALSVL